MVTRLREQGTRNKAWTPWKNDSKHMLTICSQHREELMDGYEDPHGQVQITLVGDETYT